jgi:hypothetical protein
MFEHRFEGLGLDPDGIDQHPVKIKKISTSAQIRFIHRFVLFDNISLVCNPQAVVKI